MRTWPQQLSLAHCRRDYIVDVRTNKILYSWKTIRRSIGYIWRKNHLSVRDMNGSCGDYIYVFYRDDRHFSCLRKPISDEQYLRIRKKCADFEVIKYTIDGDIRNGKLYLTFDLELINPRSQKTDIQSTTREFYLRKTPLIFPTDKDIVYLKNKTKKQFFSK